MWKTKTNLTISILRVTAVLLLLQLARSGSLQLMKVLYEPAVNCSDFIFIFVGLTLLLLFRPSKEEMGFSFDNVGRKGKGLYITATIFLLFLIITSLTLFSENNPMNIVMNLKGVVLYPVFEELLFRGYLWEHFKRKGLKEYQVYILITLLFGFWHLGYWDIIHYNASHNFAVVQMNWIMLNKVIVGMIYGLIIGLLKLKTKNTYGCILLHSLMNVFGR